MFSLTPYAERRCRGSVVDCALSLATHPGGLCGGSEWESNPPSPSEITIYGFEDRESHRTPCASKRSCRLSAISFQKKPATDLHGFSRISMNIIEEIRDNPCRSVAQVLAQCAIVNYFG